MGQGRLAGMRVAPPLGDNMRRSETIKFDVSVAPQEISAYGTTTSHDIDTQGFNRLIVVSSRGIGSGTLLIELMQSSSTDGGTYTTMPNAWVGTDAFDIDGNAITTAGYTGLDSTIVWDVDLTQCERFVKVSVMNLFTVGHFALYGFLCAPSNLVTDTEATYVQGQTTESVRYARI